MMKNLANQTVDQYLEDLLKNRTLRPGDRLPTVREIGVLCGVSTRTVGRALEKYIAKGILEQVQGSGTFLKNRISGPSQATNTIGVLFCHDRPGLFHSPFYSAVLAGIESQIFSEGRKLLLDRLFNTTDAGRQIIDLADLNGKVDGIILVDPMETVMDHIEDDIKKLPLPVVTVNYPVSNPLIDNIIVDNRGGARKMVSLLLDQGHTRIACLRHFGKNREQVGPNFRERTDGYREALEARGIPVDENLIRDLRFSGFDPLSPDGSYRISEHDLGVLQELTGLPDPPTALFCTGDQIALRIYPLIQSMELRIPDDIAVASFDDVPDSAHMNPPLTTVHIPLARMGAMAVKQLLEKTRLKNFKGEMGLKITVPVELAVRESHFRGN